MGNIRLGLRFTGQASCHGRYGHSATLSSGQVLFSSGLIVQAQPLTVPQKRSSVERLELPSLEEGDAPPALVLPPLPQPTPEDRLLAQVRIHVKRIRLEGNTVFSAEDMSKLTHEYE